METAYFLDTYALIEIVKQNKGYDIYKKGNLITTKLNLMEFHYFLLRTIGKNEADIKYDRLLPITIEISDKAIKKANEVKLFNKKRKLSYVDCLGYVLALANGAKFLTGDNQFEKMDNVEFVK